jgi:hypothetical protein
MQEILPGLYHWTTFHEGIQEEVHSYYLTATDPAILIDPRVPAEGLGWFESCPLPQQSYLTNRHHYRHSNQFEKTFGTTVWCHEAGLHEFTRGEAVKPFRHGDELPGGILALEVGVLCPEETALYIPYAGGILALGDALIRPNEQLDFVPDPLLGDDPKAVKAGLCQVFQRHLQRDFEHLLFAHGKPWIGGAKAGLQRFLESYPG